MHATADFGKTRRRALLGEVIKPILNLNKPHTKINLQKNIH